VRSTAFKTLEKKSIIRELTNRLIAAQPASDKLERAEVERQVKIYLDDNPNLTKNDFKQLQEIIKKTAVR